MKTNPDAIQVNYRASKTAASFHASDAFFRGIMGPIGSGKSVACCMEIISRAFRQRPDGGGVRRSRWAVIRNTYPELKTTTIKTWQDWFPSEVCPLKWGESPIPGRLNAPLQDGTRVDLELLFLSLDRPQDVKKLLSLELTGAWANEARELPKQVVDTVRSRVGRYPAKRHGGLSWSGVIADTNPPDDMHWWYKAAEEKTPEGWAFFRQPGALIRTESGGYEPNPLAENVKHQPLGYNYWLRQVPGADSQWIDVYILGQYGTVMAGRPVYESSWNDAAHVGDPLITPGAPLLVGWDFGLTPAAIVCQLAPGGRLLVHDEIIGDNIGVKQFADGFVLPSLVNNYPGAPTYHIGDPAGSQRAQTDERSVFDELRGLGVNIQPAPNNNLLARLESVRHYLNSSPGGQPGLVLSRYCKVLRKGFNGGYRYRQIQGSGDPRYADSPEKNAYSHPHDALQYVALHTRAGYIGGKAAPRAAAQSPPESRAWS